VRVAWFKNLNGIPIDPRIRTVVDAQRKTFESIGCIVEEAEPDFAPAEISFRILRVWSAAAAHSALFKAHPDGFKDTLRGEIEEGLAPSAADITRAEVAHTLLWRRFQAFLASYEYFILPTTQLPPFHVNTPWPTEINGVHFTNYIDWMKSCWYISATGNPAVSVPATNVNGSEATAIGLLPWQWPGKWLCGCWPWKNATETSCLPASSSKPRQRKNFLIRKTKTGSIDAQAARSRRSPPGRGRRLPRLSSSCFGTGREHKLNLLR
jgi:hypothetical protein